MATLKSLAYDRDIGEAKNDRLVDVMVSRLLMVVPRSLLDTGIYLTSFPLAPTRPSSPLTLAPPARTNEVKPLILGTRPCALPSDKTKNRLVSLLTVALCVQLWARVWSLLSAPTILSVGISHRGLYFG